MPYKKSYTTKTVATGGSKTPSSVMGSQGNSASVTLNSYKSRPTKTTKFTAK